MTTARWWCNIEQIQYYIVLILLYGSYIHLMLLLCHFEYYCCCIVLCETIYTNAFLFMIATLITAQLLPVWCLLIAEITITWDSRYALEKLQWQVETKHVWFGQENVSCNWHKSWHGIAPEITSIYNFETGRQFESRLLTARSKPA